MEKRDVVRAMELAGTAYRNCQPELSGWTLTAIDDRESGVQVYFRRRGGRLEITFRGSDSWRDWSHNLRFWKKTIPYGNTESKIRVHAGFLSAYKSPGIREKIHTLITPETESVGITGHSYGAALAVLCGVDLEYNFPRLDYEVVLFGAPRVGNNAFRRSYNRRVFKTLRIENGNDIVTKVPFAFMGFRHVGGRIHVGWPRLPLLVSADEHRPERYYARIVAELIP